MLTPRKNTFFHMLMITYLYAILSRYAILGKPELSNNSVQRFTHILMLPRKNTFFYMLMINLYAILLRYAIPSKPDQTKNPIGRLTSANRSHIAYFLCCTYYFLPPAPFS